ncbi:MAG: hypothetical protein RR565_04795 [Erysipelothrix sp.]
MKTFSGDTFEEAYDKMIAWLLPEQRIERIICWFDKKYIILVRVTKVSPKKGVDS